MDQLSTHLNFSMQSYDPTILNVTNVTVGVGRGQKIAKMLSTQFMNDFIFILLRRIYSYNVCTYIQYPCCMRNNVHIFLHNGAKPFMKQQYFNFLESGFFPDRVQDVFLEVYIYTVQAVSVKVICQKIYVFINNRVTKFFYPIMSYIQSKYDIYYNLHLLMFNYYFTFYGGVYLMGC